jgi:hypothetical protein
LVLAGTPRTWAKSTSTLLPLRVPSSCLRQREQMVAASLTGPAATTAPWRVPCGTKHSRSWRTSSTSASSVPPRSVGAWCDFLPPHVRKSLQFLLLLFCPRQKWVLEPSFLPLTTPPLSLSRPLPLCPCHHVRTAYTSRSHEAVTSIFLSFKAHTSAKRQAAPSRAHRLWAACSGGARRHSARRRQDGHGHGVG